MFRFGFADPIGTSAGLELNPFLKDYDFEDDKVESSELKSSYTSDPEPELSRNSPSNLSYSPTRPGPLDPSFANITNTPSRIRGYVDKNDLPGAAITLYDPLNRQNDYRLTKEEWHEYLETGDLPARVPFGKKFSPIKNNDNEEDTATKVDEKARRERLNKRCAIIHDINLREKHRIIELISSPGSLEHYKKCRPIDPKELEKRALYIEPRPSTLREFPDFDQMLLNLPLESVNGMPRADRIPYFKPAQLVTVGEKICPYGGSMFMNGVLNTLEDGVDAVKAISQMQGGNQIQLVYNSTFGAKRDGIKHQIILQDVLIPAAKLFKESIIEFFEKAGPNEKLHLDVHSQGGAILNKILPDIPKEYRDRMYIDTYGTAGYIPKDMAEQVRNFWHPNDQVSKKADNQGWEKALEEGTLVILEDDGKSIGEAHKLMGGYLEVLQENNKRFANGDF